MLDISHVLARSRQAVLAVVLLSCGCGFAQSPATRLTAKVDERVELLSIIFRLAGNREYRMSPLDNYTRDIDSYFAPFQNHAAVLLARKLATQNHVGFDAVMAMAVHLSPPPSLRPTVPFSDEVPDKRWGRSNGLEFAHLLHRFYVDTHFERFATAHRAMYDLAEERFAAILQSVDLSWFARFYGESPINRFYVILGMNNGGGNYGIKVGFPDGQQEAFAIMGCWTTDQTGNPDYRANADYLPTVIHEFNHSFVNPLIERYWTQFRSANNVFGPVATLMRSQAYGDAESMVNESIVRAAVILYSATQSNAHTVKLSIRREEANGFVWMPDLYHLLEQYQSHRDRYRRLQDFMPAIIRFYDSLPGRINAEISDFKAQCVHVAGMKPVLNHENTVDPELRELVIIFDKPMDPAAGVSINYGPSGKSGFPVSARPEFLAGNKELRLQLTLQPNHRYDFEVSGGSSADGYPVETYPVEFHTK